MTESRRREIYKLADTYNFLIVEDDPYCFIHFADKKPTTFLELDNKGRVIRLDSFSKILSAGLRLGVVTAHKEVIKKLTTHIEATNIHASSLSQVIFTILRTIKYFIQKSKYFPSSMIIIFTGFAVQIIRRMGSGEDTATF